MDPEPGPGGPWWPGPDQSGWAAHLSVESTPPPRPTHAGWIIAAAILGGLAAMGLLATVWLVATLPTHEDGGHGGDGATALVVMVLGGLWVAATGTLALICGLVALVKRSKA